MRDEEPVVRRYQGWDPGETVDPAAFCTIEVRCWPVHDGNEEPDLTFEVLHLERMLRVEYPEQVDHSLYLAEHFHVEVIVVDRLAAGQAAFEMVRRGGPRVVGVAATGVGQPNPAGDRWSIPKPDLVNVLLVQYQQNRICIPRDLPDRDVLDAELQAISEEMSASGIPRYTSPRVPHGGHGDYASALELAVYAAWIELRSVGGGTGASVILSQRWFPPGPS